MRRYLHYTSKEGLEFYITLAELILTMGFETVQGLSVLSTIDAYKMMTSKISMYDGTKVYYQQSRFQRK